MPVITLDYSNTKIEDTLVNRSQPGDPYGANTTILISVNHEGLIKFNLGLIPNNAVINSAVLNLTTATMTGGQPFKVHAIDSEWNSPTTTWNNKPAYDAGKVYAEGTLNGGGSVPQKIDLKALVQEWVNGRSNNGVVFTSDHSTSFGFHSIEASTGSNRPSLTIDYSIPETGKKQVEMVSNVTYLTTAAKTHTVPIPSDKRVGDRIVVFLNMNEEATDLVKPEGWEQVAFKQYLGSNLIYILSKVSDGTESEIVLSRTSNLNFTLSSTAVIYRNVKSIKNVFAGTKVATFHGHNFDGVPVNSLLTVQMSISGNVAATVPVNFRTISNGSSTMYRQTIGDTYNYNKTSYQAADATFSLGSGSYYGIYQVIALEPITNQAPNTPPINNPKGTQAAPAILTTSTPTLDWSFNDPDAGDVQSKYQVRIKKASDGSIVHDSGVLTGAATDYTVPPGMIQKNELYYWEIQTYDAQGAASSWSSPEYFKLTDQAMPGDVFTFNYTGTAQPFTVPGNVTKVKLEAWGAQGGDFLNASGSVPQTMGAKGGYAKGEYRTTGGQVLNVYVGGKGGSPAPKATKGSPGGWNGGGKGGDAVSTDYGAPGGGGASDIRTADTLESRVLVAGGGGGSLSGASANYYGGAGGGLEGGTPTHHTYAGKGGTQTAGGAGGGSSTTGNGALGLGGNGGSTSVSYRNPGAGGGSGYYGGGGGQGGNEGSGGGGSSFIGTLDGGETLSGQREGDGLVKITVLEVSNPPTVINRDPGSTDQLQPEGSSMAPLFTWDYSGNFIQAKYQVKIFDNNELLVHDSGLVASTEKQYQVPSGKLEGGKTYSWELVVVDDKNVSYPTPRLYFITNQPPSAVVPENPADNYRTGLRPTFWGTIGNDVENDPQKFVIQLAEDSGFTQNVQERNSESSAGDWQVKTKDGVYGPLPAVGVDASYEGGTVKYTWSAELTEGKTYYWRMAGIDATTGARGSWSAARRIRVGNRIDVSLKHPVETSAAIHRLLIRAQYTLATDGANPATVKFEACNNAFDENPAWEDVTDDIRTGEYHIFTNDQKTAEKWGFNIRAIFEANDSLEPIEFYGFGISFD